MQPEPNVQSLPELDVSKIGNAVRHVDIQRTGAWAKLSPLSENTLVESIEVFEDEIRLNGQVIEGAIVWHVTLNYGSGDDALVLSETFPGKFRGHLEENTFVVDEVSAETDSFYE